MEFIFHNWFDRSCRLNSALSQRYRIPNSRESQDQDQKTWTNLYRNSPYRGSGCCTRSNIFTSHYSENNCKTKSALRHLYRVTKKKVGLQIPATGVNIYRET